MLQRIRRIGGTQGIVLLAAIALAVTGTSLLPAIASTVPESSEDTPAAETAETVGAVEKTGLLVIGHGSPRAEWNRKFAGLRQPIEERLRRTLGVQATNWVVRVVFLECEPSISTAVEELRHLGCKRICAVPVFIAPSGHSRWDVPAALGLYTDPDLAREMADHGIKVPKERPPVTLTGPLSSGDVLERWAVDCVRGLSKDSANEAVVILAHGAEGVPGPLEKLLRRVSSRICGDTGISYADWAFVEVGQRYRSQGVEAITRARRVRERVLVIGLYVGLSAEQVNKHWGKGAIKDSNVVFAPHALLPDERVVTWIADNAINAVGRKGNDTRLAEGDSCADQRR